MVWQHLVASGSLLLVAGRDASYFSEAGIRSEDINIASLTLMVM